MSNILLNYQSKFKDRIEDFWNFWFRKNRYKYRSVVGFVHAAYKSKNLNVNNEGFRSKVDFSSKLSLKNNNKIFFIGPSSLFGMPSLNDEETIPYLVEKKLNTKRNLYSTFNYALLGSKINSQFSLLHQLLLENKPEYVVIYNGFNDMMGGYSGQKFDANTEIDKIIKEGFQAEENKNSLTYHFDKLIIALINKINDGLLNRYKIDDTNYNFHPLKRERRKLLKKIMQPKDTYDFCQKIFLEYLRLCFFLLNNLKIKTIFIFESSLISTKKLLCDYEKEYLKVDGELGLYKDSDKEKDIIKFSKIYHETANIVHNFAESMKIDCINFEKVINRQPEKEAIFFDNIHLSNYGADILANEIVSLIKMKENHS